MDDAVGEHTFDSQEAGSDRVSFLGLRHIRIVEVGWIVTVAFVDRRNHLITVVMAESFGHASGSGGYQLQRLQLLGYRKQEAISQVVPTVMLVVC